MAPVWVCAPALGLRLRPVRGFSAATELLQELEQTTGLSDFYVVCNGRVVDGDQPLHDGSVYRLEPRLPGGKGGFGSMLRALGAQIEKTTNREACRDLSGRRLRDVNHEKEMAEWLKKQAEREAEKEQRRLERLQKKLAEPKHNFTDSKYTQQCHELSERLEDSVIRGLQASSSSVVKPEASKRPNNETEGPQCKKSRSSAPFTWTGLDLSDDDTDQESGPESGPGAEPESGPGAEPESGPGAEPEPESGPGAEPEPESGPGAEPEPESGPGAEPEPESGPGAEPEPESGPGAEPEPESGPGAEPEPESGPGAEPEPESGPGAEPESGPGAEPEPESGPGAEPEPESGPGAEPESGPGSGRNPKPKESDPDLRGPEESRSSPPAPSEDRSTGTSPGPEEESSGSPEQDQRQSSPAPVQSRLTETRSSPEQDQSPDQRLLLDLDSVSCAEDLEALGLNVLKEELMKRGLKCGGTLSERAARLFSVRGKRDEEIDPTLLVKNKKKLK